MTAELRPSLPPLPARMRGLRVDERGYPVPFFVAWINGKPDHRIVDPGKFRTCAVHRLCWLCGEPLGRFLSAVIGPMCCVNRISAEPPQHLECAQFAVKACPFLSRPRAQRRDANLPAAKRLPGGIMLDHNPGVTAVWTALHVRPFQADTGGRRGLLFELDEPVSLSFYTEGRPATRTEVEAAVAVGIPELLAAAGEQDAQARAQFDLDVRRFEGLLDRFLP